MLKLRTFIIALAFAPLISITWQLTNQVQAGSPSKGQAGSGSGGATPPINYHPSPSKGGAGSGSGGTHSPTNYHPSPSKGGAGSGSGGTHNGSNNNPNSPSKGKAGSASGGGNTDSDNKESEAPGIIVKQEPDGSMKIKLSPAVVYKLNAAANRILASDTGHKFSSAKADKLSISLILKGVSPQLSKAFTSVLGAIFNLPGASTQPSFPSVQLPQGQLVASTKTLKASFTIAEANAPETVNIDNLNEAINIYNKIILESDPATLQKLSRSSDFMEIGKALTELRAAIK
ncbi:MAG: hypothetical protein EAZ77_16735 [Nostocales cyanobacterium]|nr:MAG: hypothetical protein EAZ77_16735 [Nostocales cyanobacterium]